MNRPTKPIAFLFGVLAICLIPRHALSDNAHHFGFSYVSGVVDVWDWHEDNLALITESGGVPIGVSYRFASIFNSGIRVDAGLGPIALIAGDIDYSDFPFQLTVGYSFSQAETSPYIRLGISQHSNSGDYVKDEAGSGAIAAIGVDFENWFFEIMFDNATATFSTAEGSSYVVARPSEEEIEVSGMQLIVGGRFD